VFPGGDVRPRKLAKEGHAQADLERPTANGRPEGTSRPLAPRSVLVEIIFDRSSASGASLRVSLGDRLPPPPR
jgi:hypothetical protein